MFSAQEKCRNVNCGEGGCILLKNGTVSCMCGETMVPPEQGGCPFIRHNNQSGKKRTQSAQCCYVVWRHVVFVEKSVQHNSHSLIITEDSEDSTSVCYMNSDIFSKLKSLITH